MQRINFIVKRIPRVDFVALAILALIIPSLSMGQEDQRDYFLEWKVEEISFEGNGFFSDNRLKDLMRLEVGDEFRQWQLEEDLDVIKDYYKRNGFIEFSVVDVVKDTDVRNGRILIEITLEEGERVIFREAVLQGNNLYPDADLIEKLKLERGDPYNAVMVDRFVKDLMTLYSERGLIHLKIESQIRLSTHEDSVDVVVILDEGPRVYVGGVGVAGNDLVSDYVIVKGSRLERGDVIRPRRLQESRQNIYQTGLFKNVGLALEDTDRADTVDVLLTVRESDFETFGIGGGYGSVEGVKANIEWNQYHIFSRAEAIRTKSEVTYQPFELSRIRFSNAYAVAFTQPFFLNTHVRAQWSLSYVVSDYLTYDQEVASFKGLFTRIFGFQKRLSFLVDFNSTRLFDIDFEEAIEDVIENEGSHLANSLTTTFVLDKREDLFYPEQKDFLTVETTLSGGPLIGEVEFYRLMADYARYWLISDSYLRPVIAARIKLGSVLGLRGSAPVLPGEQFSIGGANSLRGYREQGIGPLGEDGDPNTHSANYIFLLNLETRFTIWRKFGGVLFVDSGNVYDADFNPRSPFLLTSFGAGIRYRSPIGPIRLEGALRIDEGLSFDSDLGTIHFSVGQAF